jgi:hypothetical protein
VRELTERFQQQEKMEGVSSQQWKAYHRNKEIARHPDAEELGILMQKRRDGAAREKKKES